MSKRQRTDQPNQQFEYRVDGSAEQRLGNMIQESYEQPRILSLDTLTIDDVARVDPRRYRLMDVVKTLVHLVRGCEDVARLFDLSEKAPMMHLNSTHACPVPSNCARCDWRIVKWFYPKASIWNYIVSIGTYYPDINQFWQTMCVYVTIAERNGCQDVSCRIGGCRPTSLPSRVRSVEELIVSCFLYEVAIINAKRNSNSGNGGTTSAPPTTLTGTPEAQQTPIKTEPSH